MTLPYTHLSLAERREISRMHASKIPIGVVAERLQRHRSTIYREIKRNSVHDEEPLYRGYFHVAADMQARARRQRLSKLSRKPALAVYVIDRLKAACSPEQIAGRLRVSGAPERLSPETIYQFVFGLIPQALIQMPPHLPIQVYSPCATDGRSKNPTGREACLFALI